MRGGDLSIALVVALGALGFWWLSKAMAEAAVANQQQRDIID